MQNKQTHRALGPNTTTTAGIGGDAPTRSRPESGQQGGTPQTQPGASMDYQQGFTSGPSS